MRSHQLDTADCRRLRAVLSARRVLARRDFGGFARAASIVAVLALGAFVARNVLGGKSELLSAGARLLHPILPWVAFAIGCEALSYLMFASGEHRLLTKTGAHLRIRWLASLAVCAQGVMNFLPAGYVASTALNFRELRRRGLARPETVRLLMTSSVLYLGALAFLTILSGEIAGSRATGALTEVRVAATVVLAGVALGLLSVLLLRRRGLMRLPRSWEDHLQRSPLKLGPAASAAALFACSWLADGGCLLAALKAMGANPAWTMVPIAYCAAQLVSFLPITPGGLGLVEGSLALTLAAGGAGRSVLAAVLLYRLISYWGTLPFGALGYLAVRRGEPQLSTSLPEDGEPRAVAGRDRAAGGDRPLLVLDG